MDKFELEDGMVQIIDGKVFVNIQGLADSVHALSHDLKDSGHPIALVIGEGYHSLWNALLDYQEDMLAEYLNDKLNRS